MKNQNFGDNRDLLKFDLVSHIFRAGLVKHFTYIPMLTRDVVREEESHVCRHDAAGGISNTELVDFLDRCIINDKRNINQLDEYLNKCGISSTIYAKNEYFTHEGRRSYFTNIPGEYLRDSLILIDPDKGLEERNNDSGNLLYSELREVYDRMGERSILMFTQRFPYDLYETYLEMRTGEIKFNIPTSQPVSLDDLDTIVFFLIRDGFIRERFLELLRDYVAANTKKQN